MNGLFAVGLLLTLTNELATGSHCRVHGATNFRHCGDMPTATNPSTVRWSRGSGSYVDYASLEIRKAGNISSQTATGCLHTEQVVSESNVSSSSFHSVPIVDYDSLYIARMLWYDSSNNPYYHVNSECYFIPGRNPWAPENVEAVNVTLSSITWMWDKPRVHDNRVTSYQVSNGTEVRTATGTCYKWTGLSADTQYRLRVRALTGNSQYSSNWSSWASVYTLPPDTLQPSISAVQFSDFLNYADIMWNTRAQATVIGYDVRVVAHMEGMPQSPSVYLMHIPTTNKSMSYRVTQRFTPKTEYTFQVRSWMPVGTSQWSTPVVKSTLPDVPNNVSGFSLNSSLSTISMSWNGSSETIDYYRLTLHNVAANTTEHSDLFHTVNSSTFHDLTPNTAYTVTITAVNKAGSGPTVSVTVTTQSPAVQPLAVTTGIFGTIVFIGVAVLLLIGGVWWGGKYVIPKLRDKSRSSEDKCEIEENAAYATLPRDRLWSQGFFFQRKEGEGGEEDQAGDSGEREGTLSKLECTPDIPSRKYLKEKKKGPTEFASIAVYPDEMTFQKESGWFEPAPADIIAEKLEMKAPAFADLGPGVYLMCHKTKKQAKWVGVSPDLCRTLTGLFFKLYQKERSELSPLEVELKFFSPLAAEWDVKVWTVEPKDLVLERAKKIVEYKTLTPLGLNNALTFNGKEVWEEFSGWFSAKKRKQK